MDSEPEEEEEVDSEEEVEAEVVLIPEALEMVTLNKLMVMPRMRNRLRKIYQKRYLLYRHTYMYTHI